MSAANIFVVALRALRKNKMRSFLTMLGIIIGVGAVITMLAIGQGAEYSVKQQIDALGTNVLIILPGSSSQGGIRSGAGTMTNLTEADAQAILNECPDVAFVSPISMAGGQIIAGNLNWFTAVFGVGTDYLSIRKWDVDYGETFDEQDIKANSKICLIGQTVADNLFPGQDPVGQTIRIRNVPFKIIGLLAKKGQNALGQDQDDIILAPYTTVLIRLSRFPYLRQILVSAVSEKAIPVAKTEIEGLLRQRHKLQPYDSDDFTIRDQTDLVNTATETSKILTILLASIASVSLIVGGIGIMNIMLVSVTERTREIGIRMSVGARGKDILTQFLIEALVLSLIGGFIGILFGTTASKLISGFADWPTFISLFSILVSFGFSILIGIFFGFYPAKKAAMLNPIEALRYE